MPKKVLIAEDFEDTRELIKLLVEDLGYEVFEATDGYEAIKIIRREIPDLVLMDISLPLLDGLSVTKIVRDFPDIPKMPIIAITAHSNSFYKKAIDAGCNDLLEKPIYSDTLEPILKQYLGESEKQKVEN